MLSKEKIALVLSYQYPGKYAFTVLAGAVEADEMGQEVALRFPRGAGGASPSAAPRGAPEGAPGGVRAARAQAARVPGGNCPAPGCSVTGRPSGWLCSTPRKRSSPERAMSPGLVSTSALPGIRSTPALR